MADGSTRAALVAGGSGMVGRALLGELVAGGRHGPVIALTRRPIADLPGGVTELAAEDLTRLPKLPRIDDVFVTLGTTIAKAGSREAFARVDHDMVIAVAAGAHGAGARRCFVVTSMGADAGSRVFYNRVKGQTEDDLRALGYETLWIFRPSLLTGERDESRPGEAVASVIGRGLRHVMVGPLRKYRPIEGVTVARAMVRAAGDPATTGERTLLSDEIQALGA